MVSQVTVVENLTGSEKADSENRLYSGKLPLPWLSTGASAHEHTQHHYMTSKTEPHLSAPWSALLSALLLSHPTALSCPHTAHVNLLHGRTQTPDEGHD